MRERVTQLSVHIPCGQIRGPIGPLQRSGSTSYGRWQSCVDEDAPQKWAGCDVSREFDLCVICFRATAGGTSRWAWLACEDCRTINDRIGSRWGFRPFALGRHSLMNGVGVALSSTEEAQREQIDRLVEFVRSRDGLRGWHSREYARLASRFDPLADIPLRRWQEQWPPGRDASEDAFTRLFGGSWPLPPI
ncbi:hypothetical protein [Mycobacterium sp. IDR2000157661]|uniref:hypothetical protein n=1 Tax=Mycobacterium sp. IDR2000157661 TaxID=2867005 RepID=UPI001EEBE8B4|nr:hypothetical protein [Mycobacterium sp. IDR2000157661]